MWYKYFDAIFLINLLSRTDRLIESATLLKRYSIPYTRWYASVAEDGKEGVFNTMNALFFHCLRNNYERILCFEDDVSFLLPPKEFNDTMDSIIDQLQKIDGGWHMFKLGVTPITPIEKFISPNILPIGKSYGLHACAYNRFAMKFLSTLPKELPIDVHWSKTIEPMGKCFCSYPLLATQKEGYSDIEKKIIDQGRYVTQTYKTYTNKLLNPKQ